MLGIQYIHVYTCIYMGSLQLTEILKSLPYVIRIPGDFPETFFKKAVLNPKVSEHMPEHLQKKQSSTH